MTNYKNRDLSKIDFTKLTSLPKFQDSELRVAHDKFWNPFRGIGIVVTVRDADNLWIAALDESGKWYSGLNFCDLDTHAEIHSICKQVDAFIESELAAMNKPNWVDVKWTEVERLSSRGARVQYQVRITGWRDREAFSFGRGGVSCGIYRVDTKTVPDGVELYEPQWVNVSWDKVERIAKTETRIQTFDSSEGNWDERPEMLKGKHGSSFTKYRFDAKTLPVGLSVEQVTGDSTPVADPIATSDHGPIRAEFENRLTTSTGYPESIHVLVDILDEKLAEIRDRIK